MRGILDKSSSVLLPFVFTTVIKYMSTEIYMKDFLMIL